MAVLGGLPRKATQRLLPLGSRLLPAALPSHAPLTFRRNGRFGIAAAVGREASLLSSGGLRINEVVELYAVVIKRL